MKTPAQIKNELEQFIGSINFYKHTFGIIYTDGIKFLADECQCYWLIDVVASYQYHDKVKEQEFQVYKLKVNADKSASINIEDGNYNIVASQDIEYTDFPLSEIEIWFCNNTCYLPSEH
jgi:hypothetical protein